MHKLFFLALTLPMVQFTSGKCSGLFQVTWSKVDHFTSGKQKMFPLYLCMFSCWVLVPALLILFTYFCLSLTVCFCILQSDWCIFSSVSDQSRFSVGINLSHLCASTKYDYLTACAWCWEMMNVDVDLKKKLIAVFCYFTRYW